MGNNVFDAATYEMEYIPQRLAALEVCVLGCHSILSNRVDSTELNINFGSSVLIKSDLSILVNLALDSGLIANRTLLNFMGIKLSNRNLINAENGLTVSEFHIPLITVEDATTILLPEIRQEALKAMWIEALTTASKSVAHFTEQGALIRVARLGYACYGTSKLVRERFYSTRQNVEPETLLTNDVIPVFSSVWDSVDPQLNVKL